MEKKEENYIRQLLLELEDYLFSLKWYDKEDNEIMLKNIIGFDSIFQIIPKRFHKLLEGKIYTQEELDKAREEGFDNGVEKTVNIIQRGLDELLLEKGEEKYWVGDILRDCGYTVEMILPKSMKGYLVKLKTKE